MGFHAAMNATIEAFDYPRTLLREYDQWVVLLRPKQATLGALVLACKGPARAFSDIPAAAFAELATATRDIEATLRAAFACEKLNYLMLMMVDPEVHFHVLPRYAGERALFGARFTDPGWPKIPDLGHENALTTEQFDSLHRHLAASWVS
jgi:diadenosine tetraphosphate (Ap4A) HIT family hydrolase